MTPGNSNYDDIKITFEDSIFPENYLDVRIIFIQFGRNMCRVLSPRCGKYILNDIYLNKELIKKKLIHNG
jgi:endonuclease III